MGIRLEKFAVIAKETEKFLEMLGEDVGLEADGNWLAKNFKNSSVIFDCERIVSDSPAKQRALHALRAVMVDSDDSIVRQATRRQYFRIADQIDLDERVSFGLYTNGSEEPEEWHALSKELALKASEAHPHEARYLGEIQGVVHAFYKESKKPKIVIRELSTKKLVDCFFPKEMYESAVQLLEDKDQVVFVEGEAVEDLDEGRVISIEVSTFYPAPNFDRNFHAAFLGRAPDLTGSMTTEDFIDKEREED